jgi:tetratricopeptide (TPR) repeat protein
MVIAAALLLSTGVLGAQTDSPPSIEDLTEKYRERSEAAVEALRAEVEYLLAQLRDHAKSDRQTSMEQVREKLVDLGSEVSPLLISSLEPGRKPERASLNFATQVAYVLQQLDLAPILSPLIKMATDGSNSGRRLAIQVLGYSQDTSRVSPILKELFTGESPPRGVLLTSLARLGGPDDLSFVTDQLRSDEREEVSAALYALATAKIAGAADHILVFAADTREAAAHVKEICAWYQACPDVFDKQHGASILELTKSSRVNLEDRIALVKLLSKNERHWPSGAKKTLETLADSGSKDLREAVLIALALSGDRGAKKELLLPYQESLARSVRWADAWIDLASIEYRIEEYRDAIKHYEQAMKLGRIDTRRQRDVYLGLARCYALEKKYKDAQQWLQRAPISRKQLAELANDPDFREMAAHSKYGKTFGSDEG